MKLQRIKNTSATVISTSDTEILWSYSTPVAARIKGKCYRTEKKWSRTTSGHINKFLEGNKAETKPQEFFDKMTTILGEKK